MSSRDWQSFRSATDGSQNAQLLSPIQRRTGARRKVSSDPLCLYLERPEANAEESKCFKMFECRMLIRFRQQNNCDVSKEAIPVRLHQSLAPVTKLHLESEQFRIDAGHKDFCRHVRASSRQAARIPADDHEVSDAVPVRGNFSRIRQRSFSCAKETVSRCCNKRLTKTIGKHAFATAPCLMPRKIPHWIVEPKLRDLSRGGCCHRVVGASTRYAVTSPQTTYLTQTDSAVNNRLL